jgi:TetR/AcrR family transcriptional regulator
VAILQATAQVYAQRGYHGTSVERILEAANVSRPTFYRYFSGGQEAIETIVREANDQLRTRIVAAVLQLRDLARIVHVGIGVYFDWCRDLGPLVGPMYSEIHDRTSPASLHRARIIEGFVALFSSQLESLGQPRRDPLLYDALLRVIENAGSSAYWPEPLPASEVQRRRDIAEQIVCASLDLPCPPRGHAQGVIS